MLATGIVVAGGQRPEQLPSYPNTYVDTAYTADMPADPTAYCQLPTLPYECPRCGAVGAWVLTDESYADANPWVFVNTDPMDTGAGYWVCHSNAHRRVVCVCPCFHEYVVRYDGGAGDDGFRYYSD